MFRRSGNCFEISGIGWENNFFVERPFLYKYSNCNAWNNNMRGHARLLLLGLMYLQFSSAETNSYWRTKRRQIICEWDGFIHPKLEFIILYYLISMYCENDVTTSRICTFSNNEYLENATRYWKAENAVMVYFEMTFLFDKSKPTSSAS